MRIAVTILFLASVVLGYLGFSAYAPSNPGAGSHFSHNPADLVYYDLELFLVQATPLTSGPPYPWPLQVARFTAPAVVAWAALRLITGLVSHRLRLARTRRMRGHVVVCGATRAADALTRRLTEQGRRVVRVVPGADLDFALNPDRDTVAGDARSARTLRDAGAPSAATVYACLADTADNLAVVREVARLRRPSHAQTVHALIGDLDMCLALRTRRLSLREAGGPRLDFFNPDELAAQAMVREDPMDFAGRPEIAVIGTGAFATAVISEYVRTWRAIGDPRRRLRVVLAGADARRVAATLCGRLRFLAESCELIPYDGTLAALLTERIRDGDPPLGRLVICHDDEVHAIRDALDSAAIWHELPERIIVRLNQFADLGAAFRDGTGHERLFDTLGGRLYVVDVTEACCAQVTAGQDFSELLARGIHDHYLRQRVAGGAGLGSGPSVVRWHELPEEYQAANRAQAADLVGTLVDIGCTFVPRAETNGRFALADHEIERLALREHDRWVRERRARGWHYGPRRDERRRHHPDLVSWDSLPESARDKDRQAVVALPGVLADIGVAVLKTGPAQPTQPVRPPVPNGRTRGATPA